MHHCPSCELLLTSAEIGGQILEGCDECGGVWVRSAVLADLVKHAPALLATVDERFNPAAATSLGVSRVPVCAECGGELSEHRFPIAPQLPLLSCARCHSLWLRDGQCYELMVAINPELAAPARAARAAEDEAVAAPDDDDLAADRAGTLSLVLSLWWPRRLARQPVLPWLVCGMPLWFAAVLAIGVPAWLIAGHAAEQRLGGAHGAMCVFAEVWFSHAAVLLVVLSVLWAARDSVPDCTVPQRYLLLLRVSPTVNLLTIALGWLVWQCYPPAIYMTVFVSHVWLIWQAAELEPLQLSDAKVLTTRAPWYF